MRRILTAVTQATQSFYSKLEETGQPWSLKQDYMLNVSSNTADYLLSLDDSYGKPLQVLTYYPQNPSYVQRQVEFVEFADMNFNWPFPVNMASWLWTDGSNCTAMRMAFYKQDDGSSWVRVLPQPQLAASYLISYSSGDWASQMALENSPVLTQFHPLVETWATQSVLPSCQWLADQKYNMAHRDEIARALENDRVRLEDDFDRYRRYMVDDHMGIRRSCFDGEDVGTWM
jgi:hypothetical protein